MNPLRKALFDALSADATLTAMLASPDAIYHRLAPEGAEVPYVIFRQVSGGREWAFQAGQVRWPIWLVKAVDRNPSASAAEGIDARIDALLTDATLSVEGFTHLYCRREIDMPEPVVADVGEPIQECGGLYRIGMEPL